MEKVANGDALDASCYGFESVLTDVDNSSLSCSGHIQTNLQARLFASPLELSRNKKVLPRFSRLLVCARCYSASSAGDRPLVVQTL